MNTNLKDNQFNQNNLLGQLLCEYDFLLDGISIGDRVIRFNILNTINSWKPDIVMGYEFSPLTLYLLFLKRIGVLKQFIGTTTDDSLAICENVQTKARYLARKFSVKNLDFIVVLSNEVANYYNKTLKIDNKKIIVFPLLQNHLRIRKDEKILLNIATEYFNRYDLVGKKVILFVGRLVSEKGLAMFLTEIKSHLEFEPNIKIIIVGDGVLKQELVSLVDNYSLNDKVIFTGRFEGLNLNAWYFCASGFVLPSIYEPYGAVVNEALIFGLKVLCSKYAGAANLLTEKNGLIYDPLSKTDSKIKISKFIDSINTINCINLNPSLIELTPDNYRSNWKFLAI